MGADEQLAGYGRHRSAFRDRSWPGLVAEIQTQLLGICERNLGRDDRVISDHGREARSVARRGGGAVIIVAEARGYYIVDGKVSTV